jgi:hypothetical protein
MLEVLAAETPVATPLHRLPLPDSLDLQEFGRAEPIVPLETGILEDVTRRHQALFNISCIGAM